MLVAISRRMKYASFLPIFTIECGPATRISYFCGVARPSHANPQLGARISADMDDKHHSYPVQWTLFFTEICLLFRSDSPLVRKTSSSRMRVIFAKFTPPRMMHFCGVARQSQAGIHTAHARTSAMENIFVVRGAFMQGNSPIVACATCGHPDAALGIKFGATQTVLL